jgi:hypothetical protein
MAKVDEAEKKRRLDIKIVLIALILLVSVIVAGWALVTVSKAFQIPPSDFVNLPTTPISRTGEVVVFDSITSVGQNGVTVGVQGYLKTASGQPVAGANVYVQYYLEGSYRTQFGITDANGYFEIQFPMNWTGWLPLTMIYFGDAQHQGVQQVISLSGENL